MDMQLKATHQAQLGIEIVDEHPRFIPQQVSKPSSTEPQNPCANPDWLRSFKGCEQYSDEEALEISESIVLFAKILMEST